jgi:hypothetical protein
VLEKPTATGVPVTNSESEAGFNFTALPNEDYGFGQAHVKHAV